VFNSVVEMEANAGAGNHAGYYVWTQGAVNEFDLGLWNDAGLNCASTSVDTTCLGNGNADNSVDVGGVPSSSGGPTLNNVGGFRPIPVPRAFDIDGDGNAGTKAGVKGFYQLAWDAAASLGKNPGRAPAGYEVWAAKSTGSSGNPGSCTPPTQAAFLRVVQVPATPTQAEITDAQLVSAGVGPLGPTDCVTFALKVRFGATLNATPIVSRYVSANGQSFFGTGGLSASVYELAAKYAGKNNVNVSWKTSLEDGVRGFYVSRATTQSGEYTRVSELISAKGEPSAYSFIDTIQPPAGNVKATGLWYKVETIDIDDNAVEYGPTKAQLPRQDGGAIIKQRTTNPKH
jgi:hypothetical protein